MLSKLNLIGVPDVGEKGLESLTTLVNLQKLTLMSQRVDDRAMAQVAGLPALRELVVLNGHVTGAGIDHLAALPDLRRLFMNNIDHDADRRLHQRNSRVVVQNGPETALLREAAW